jgi:hypothetical protein
MKRTCVYQLVVNLAIVISVALLFACRPSEPPQEPTEPATPPASGSTSTSSTTTGDACPQPPPCGDNCSNYPFVPTDCWTTEYGPAKADVIMGDPLTSSNMLYCNGGTYALCFYSGPPNATGKDPSANSPLPCVMKGDIAQCTCQAYTSGAYFVDINGILNRGAYDQTVQACGQDGSKCANIGNCGPDGRKPGCERYTQAPVCQYVKNQNPEDPTGSLMPKADLISTFSFAMAKDYETRPTPCTAGLYAGCMTAPCSLPESATGSPADGDPVQCDCPTYNGVYQVGQPGQQCTIPAQDGNSYVWSASNSVSTSSSGQ